MDGRPGRELEFVDNDEVLVGCGEREAALDTAAILRAVGLEA